MLEQSLNHSWKDVKGGLNEKYQKRKPSRRTNSGFVNDVLSSWQEMKIEHVRNAIDTQREVMLEMIEKEGGATSFLSSNTASKSWKCSDIASQNQQFYACYRGVENKECCCFLSFYA